MGRIVLLLCRHYYANQAGVIGNASKECSNPGIFNEMNATKYAVATKWNAPWFVGEYGIAPTGCLENPGVRLVQSSVRICLSDTCPPLTSLALSGHHKQSCEAAHERREALPCESQASRRSWVELHVLVKAGTDVALACTCTGIEQGCMLTERCSLQGATAQEYIQSLYTTMNDLLLSGTQWDWAYWTPANKDGFDGINLSVVDQDFNTRSNYAVWPYVQVKHYNSACATQVLQVMGSIKQHYFTESKHHYHPQRLYCHLAMCFGIALHHDPWQTAVSCVSIQKGTPRLTLLRVNM